MKNSLEASFLFCGMLDSHFVTFWYLLGVQVDVASREMYSYGYEKEVKDSFWRRMRRDKYKRVRRDGIHGC